MENTANPVKIAVAGKGGTGKTTLCAALAVLFSREGRKVVVVDADPSPNLASALGVPDDARRKIVPISKMLDLIEERTGVRPGESSGKMFVLNPMVDDLLERYGIDCIHGIKLLVLGTVTAGGSGCFCPENAMLRSLLKHLSFSKGDVLIMDMEAGVEHLGRSTAQNVDVLVAVAEPSVKSVEIAGQIRKLAGDIGIRRIAGVVNKAADSAEGSASWACLRRQAWSL
jgi:CO dehydrogenase maturation factor